MIELHNSETGELIYIDITEIVAIVQLQAEAINNENKPRCTRIDIKNGSCYLVEEEAIHVYQLWNGEP